MEAPTRRRCKRFCVIPGNVAKKITYLQNSRRALKIVGLEGYESQLAASLAYGHRRLLEIARAIVSSPKLLLLDEPAAGFNISEAANLVRLIRADQRERDHGGAG